MKKKSPAVMLFNWVWSCEVLLFSYPIKSMQRSVNVDQINKFPFINLLSVFLCIKCIIFTIMVLIRYLTLSS